MTAQPQLAQFCRPLTAIATVVVSTLMLGMVAMEPGRAALDHPNLVQQAGPSQLEAKMMAAFDELETGSPVRALSLLTEVIKQDNTIADAYNLRGVAQMMLQRYPEALADFSQAIALDPDDPAFYFNRANVYGVMEDFAAARDDCGQGMVLDPEDIDLVACRGQALLALGEPRLALADFNRALQIDPRSGESHYYRALAHGMLGQYPQALADLDRAIRLNPNDADALVLRAGIRAEQGDRDGSIEDMISAINVLERQGQAQKAMEIRQLLGF